LPATDRCHIGKLEQGILCQVSHKAFITFTINTIKQAIEPVFGGHLTLAFITGSVFFIIHQK
jgi:hypothetical protein